MQKSVFWRGWAAFPLGLLLICGALPSHAQSSGALEFAIVPYLPTATILERYQPLRDYLEWRFREPVSVVSAPDYASFVARTQRGEYTFVITSSHAARLAEVEAGYRPMLRPGWDTYATLFVRKDSPYQDIKDLRGKIIATPGPYAIVSQLGGNWLNQIGLKPGRDVFLQTSITHTTALHAVVAGEADAGFISNRAFVAAKSDLKGQVRSLGQSKESGGPGVVYMAHPAISAQRVAAIKEAVLAFVQTEAGNAFVAGLGYDTLREVKPGELARLDPYMRELKQVIQNETAKP